jgi:hypothetical protein
VVHGLETLKRLNDEATKGSDPDLHHIMFVGGKFDCHCGRFSVSPRIGDANYQIFGRMYHKYVFNGSVFVFDSIEP